MFCFSLIIQQAIRRKLNLEIERESWNRQHAPAIYRNTDLTLSRLNCLCFCDGRFDKRTVLWSAWMAMEARSLHQVVLLFIQITHFICFKWRASFLSNIYMALAPWVETRIITQLSSLEQIKYNRSLKLYF